MKTIVRICFSMALLLILLNAVFAQSETETDFNSMTTDEQKNAYLNELGIYNSELKNVEVSGSKVTCEISLPGEELTLDISL